MSKINYDLWKNENGKVVIPDGVTTTWPEGDALVGNFIYNEGNLSGFVDTMALVANESKSTTIPYDYVDITVDKSLEGIVTFHPGERCKHLNISYTESGNTIVLGTKYLGCKTIDDIKAIDPEYKTNDIIDGVWNQSLADLELSGKLKNDGHGDYVEWGTSMFYHCSNLTNFTSDLSSLTNGSRMFYGCSNLTNFASDMSSLIDSYGMFNDCSNLTTFTSDLSSLTDGEIMFSNCRSLTTFDCDIKSLRIGNYMFCNCANLSSFNSSLENLTNGYYMFDGCKLDTPSILKIANTINDVNGLEIDCDAGINTIFVIGIANTAPNTEEDAAFHLMAEKGWTVYVNGNTEYNNSDTCLINSMTLDENGEEISTPIPFYAKPIQTDEKHGRYMDSEGNYFNILGAQFIYGDDLSTYGMFLSEEDAALNMGLTKIEK